MLLSRTADMSNQSLLLAFSAKDVAIHSAGIAQLVSAVIKFSRAPNDIDPFATYAT